LNRGWIIAGVLLLALVFFASLAFKLLGVFIVLLFKYWYVAAILIGLWLLIRLFRKRPEDKGIYRDSKGSYIETEYKVEDDDAAKRK